MDDEEAIGLVFTAITQAVNGDDIEAATTLRWIGGRCDSTRMYGVCCAIAAMGAGMLTAFHGPRENGEFWRLTALRPGALEANPAHAFALRFLVAYANDDEAMAWALYRAAEGAADEECVESVSELLSTVAGLVRAALDEQHDDGVRG
ncbi:hypothetical protein [Streptomyces sp. NPDC002537]